MLGLNLNTSMPYSPFGEHMCQSPNCEDEVDAVTGVSVWGGGGHTCPRYTVRYILEKQHSAVDLWQIRQ